MSIENQSVYHSPEDEQLGTDHEPVFLGKTDEQQPLATPEQQLQSLMEVIQDSRTSPEVRQSLWDLAQGITWGINVIRQRKPDSRS